MDKKRLLELAGVQLNEEDLDWTDPHTALQDAVTANARWIISVLVDHYEELRDAEQLADFNKVDLKTFVDQYTSDEEIISDRMESLDKMIARKVREMAPQAVKELRRGRIARKRQERE